MFRVVSLLLSLATCQAATSMTSVHSTGGSNFQGHFVFPVHELIDGWQLKVTFSSPIVSIQEMNGKVGKIQNMSADKTMWVINNEPHSGIAHSGSTLDIVIHGQYSGNTQPTAVAELVNMGTDAQILPSYAASHSTKYDYHEVLMKSILFYEAQRSGKLPANNRIPWRGDSALGDIGANGEDLTGGWYDAGDNVKFGYPMAGSVTLLAWSLLKFKDAYEQSRQLESMYDCIRWPLEFFIKSHTAPNTLYVQIGDANLDHSFWGRAEDMTMSRPAFQINQTHPGSDAAGEYAAAMAAGYLVFKDKDPSFAAQLLSHAKQLNTFAMTYKALYGPSIKATNYGTSDFRDELSWAGAWLYKATKQAQYLHQAEDQFVRKVPADQGWGDKLLGSTILLYEITKNQKYRDVIEGTFTAWLPGGTITYTPKGLAFGSLWGSNRIAANYAFMALLAAEDNIHSTRYRAWAMTQIHYILGDAGRSFVVGFGHNPPSHEHHRSSSCPKMPAPCTQFDFTKTVPNPHVLYGALVGGPDKNDHYEDDRSDYVKNEVACDYNAGFQGAVSGLASLNARGLLSTISPDSIFG